MRKSLPPLLQVGAAIEDLTPQGLWDSDYHIVSMSDEQFAALQQILGEASAQQDYEDITPTIASKPTASSGYLYCRGGRIPNDTRFRAKHLSRMYEAEVRGGKVWLNQKAYDSPSKAARAITKTQVNGWKWWEYYDEQANKWRSLSYLRIQQNKTQAA